VGYGANGAYDPDMNHDDLTGAMAAAARTLAVDQVTAEVVGALRREGIDPLLLKGPSFARLLYRPDELRPYVDTDLLVAPGDQDRAAGVLAGLGFADPMAGALEHERDDHSRTFRRDRDGSVAEVDLHFTLAGARAAPAKVWALVSGETVEQQVAGERVRVFSVPALAMHSALHAAQDGRDTAQPLQDLARAVETVDELSWHAALGLARAAGATAAFAAGLERSEPGRDLLARLDPALTGGAYERLRGGTPPPMSLGIARLMERRDARGLARELAREVVPTPAFMRTWSPLARRGRLGLAAAYAWRPLWLLLRLGPAVRAYLRARRTRT
jgi:hypothetical protein